MSFGLNEHRSPHNVGFGYALNGTPISSAIWFGFTPFNAHSSVKRSQNIETSKNFIKVKFPY